MYDICITAKRTLYINVAKLLWSTAHLDIWNKNSTQVNVGIYRHISKSNGGENYGKYVSVLTDVDKDKPNINMYD